MITKCWIIIDTPESAMAVKTIEHNFPCFTFVELDDDGGIEFTVKCRQEDAAAIQDIIRNYLF